MQLSAPRIAAAPPPEAVGAPRVAGPTLFCAFTNFADRTPLVGFHYRIIGERSPPSYALVFQREQDGSQAEFGDQGVPSPERAFDGTEEPAVIRAPEDGMRIKLYGYKANRRGTHWFEAGLRSVRYKNLGGRCRLSA
ncbi:hypothetical protein AFCDBAGC_4789 [Methylobacterium cerastii]|uniref:Uncharacterized protein n=2 Tax=Methylobacteriaceae TaxID=119045 RepID=A0ABQ4QNV5_9HYPH|nr:hypothetical protein AFCDBAGC_4789 [Methylobacterium cerastii]